MIDEKDTQTQQIDFGNEYHRGAEGLFSTCESSQYQQEGYEFRKTTAPTTSPAVGTPAFSALSAGEAVWEPVAVVKRGRGQPKKHADAAAKQKAYRERMKAEGKRVISRVVLDVRDESQPLKSDIIDLSAVRNR